jgi:hypothetical protein
METTIRLEKETLEVRMYQPQWQRIVLLAVLACEGAGGIFGAALLILEPDGRLLDMPVGIMHGMFQNFLVPGIILLLLGALNVFSFVSVLRRSPNDWLLAGLGLGGFLVWFVVEIVILQELHWLHLILGVPVLVGWLTLIPLIALRNLSMKTMAVCGILSSVWYIFINIYVPSQYEGYSMASFTPSELSAIGSPTRVLWVLLVLLYPLLFGAFGWGLWMMANKRSLRVVGAMIIAYCFFNLYWPPMHMRGVATTITDTLHIVWAFITVLSMVLMMAFGGTAFGLRFRIYTYVSIALHIIFGILTSLQAPNIPIDGPTPTIGIWERMNIAIFMIWVIMLAINVMRQRKDRTVITIITKR